MSFPRYPKYKDSGVEWLGEVPEHWSVEPFKRQIERNDGGVWGDDPDGLNDTIVLRSTEQTVDGRWQLDDPAPRKLTESEINAALLSEGDLLLTKSSGSSLHIGKTTLVTAEIAAMRCCYSNFMQRIRTKASFSPKLAWHVLNNELARNQFDLLSNSSTGLANLNSTMVGQILVIVPSLAEQTAIAAFLDRETGKIDELVAEQRRLMELLKEKRQAVISHAVTRGLNPAAPLQPSGIEWLGDVPAHWEVKPLGRITLSRCDGPFGSGLKSEHYAESGVRVIRLQNIRAEGFNDSDAAFIDKEYHDDELTGHEVVAGDVLIAGLGDDNNLVGRACVAPGGIEPAMVKADCFRFRLDRERALPTFVATVLSVSATFDAGVLATGTTRSRIPLSITCGRRIPLPPLAEQTTIVAHLERELATFDALTTEAQRAIALLQERRTALISAAVTGQIDVRAAGR